MDDSWLEQAYEERYDDGGYEPDEYYYEEPDYYEEPVRYYKDDGYEPEEYYHEEYVEEDW